MKVYPEAVLNAFLHYVKVAGIPVTKIELLCL